MRSHTFALMLACKGFGAAWFRLCDRIGCMSLLARVSASDAPEVPHLRFLPDAPRLRRRRLRGGAAQGRGRSWGDLRSSAYPPWNGNALRAGSAEFFEDEGDTARRFEVRLQDAEAETIDGALSSEIRFDPDCWIVEIELDDCGDLLDIVTDATGR